MPHITNKIAEAEKVRFRESEEVFYRRIFRAVKGNEIPGMEAWNVDNAAAMLERMWSAYQQSVRAARLRP